MESGTKKSMLLKGRALVIQMSKVVHYGTVWGTVTAFILLFSAIPGINTILTLIF
jgi:hypothetical protein